MVKAITAHLIRNDICLHRAGLLDRSVLLAHLDHTIKFPLPLHLFYIQASFYINFW